MIFKRQASQDLHYQASIQVKPRFNFKVQASSLIQAFVTKVFHSYFVCTSDLYKKFSKKSSNFTTFTILHVSDVQAKLVTKHFCCKRLN